MKRQYLLPFALLFTITFLMIGCEKTETGGVLLAPKTEAGATENNEGIRHYKEEHWRVAEKHFLEAIDANPQLAEAHYNLAMTLEKLGNPWDATDQFLIAKNLVPDNPKITDSPILKHHLGLQ
jgi:tetratricopeptide (TPR) repeat protein